MYYPCETCKIRFNREFSEKCNKTCDYAIKVKELFELKQQIKNEVDKVKDSNF